MSKKTVFHKQGFEKTSAARREKVIQSAIQEFVEKGYSATNINIVAEKAGVSIGAMYSYFASKEDLFLAIVSYQYEVLENALGDVNLDQTFFQVVEQLFYLTMNEAKQHPHLSQIYLETTTQSMAPLAKRLTHQLEACVHEFLISLIEKGKAEGAIKAEVNTNVLAFCLDNLLMVFQFSFSSDYYKERMRLFIGDKMAQGNDELIRGIMMFIKQQCCK